MYESDLYDTFQLNINHVLERPGTCVINIEADIDDFKLKLTEQLLTMLCPIVENDIV